MNKIESLENDFGDDNNENLFDSLDFWENSLDSICLPPRICISSYPKSNIHFYPHNNEKKESKRLKTWKFFLGEDAIENDMIEETVQMIQSQSNDEGMRYESKKIEDYDTSHSSNQNPQPTKNEKQTDSRNSNTFIYLIFFFLLILVLYFLFSKKN
jgi:hypothetical protein